MTNANPIALQTSKMQKTQQILIMMHVLLLVEDPTPVFLCAIKIKKVLYQMPTVPMDRVTKPAQIDLLHVTKHIVLIIHLQDLLPVLAYNLLMAYEQSINVKL